MQSLFLITFIIKYTNCAQILCYFLSPSVSHQQIFQPVWKELSLRGHQVTVVTPNPLNDPQLTNLTEIDVSFTYELITQHKFIETLSNDNNDRCDKVKFLYDMGIRFFEKQMQHRTIRDIIKDKNKHFDLLIVQESFSFIAIHGLSSRFKVPVVAISSVSLFLHSHDAMGNPTHPIVSPDMMLNLSGELSFVDRLNSFLYNIWYRMFYYWYALPHGDRIARKYFGEDMPYLGDLQNNISLILANVNPVMHSIRPNVPNVIEISQMHIRDKKPLPKDLQDYLDSSKEGVVYLSLGSNVKSANLTEKVRNEIVGAISELPFNVLWKWETDYLPNQPKNVMIRKWLPQQDVLGHPNIKAFVTQGGIQSIEEAITNEVPMVGIPFITDQPSNVKRIIELGMGLGIDYKTFRKTDLKNAILEVTSNKKYKEEVKKSKAILTDQPMKGIEKAIWWIEYVIRHKGAKHLRSPAADMSFFKYFMVDVVLFLLVCVILSVYSIFKILSVLRMCLEGKITKKIKKH